MRDPRCDCTGGDLIHDPDCAFWDAPAAEDVAAQVAAEDGYPACRSAIRHPSHAQTRAHFKTNPLPRQRKGAA